MTDIDIEYFADRVKDAAQAAEAAAWGDASDASSFADLAEYGPPEDDYDDGYDE